MRTGRPPNKNPRVRWNTTVLPKTLDDIRMCSEMLGLKITDMLDEALNDYLIKCRSNSPKLNGFLKEKNTMINNFNQPRNTKSVVFVCSKGGVGKTTSCTCMSHLLSNEGRRILIIDADHQGNSTSAYIPPTEETIENTLYDYISALGQAERRTDFPSITGYIHSTSYVNIDIIVGDHALQAADAILRQLSLKKRNPFQILLKELKGLEKYDFVMIDTNPSMNEMCSAILEQVDWAIVPTNTSGNSVQGATDTVNLIVDDYAEAGYDIKLAGVLFCAVDQKTALAKQVIPAYREQMADAGVRVFDTIIKQSESVKKAEYVHKPLSAYVPVNTVSKCYRQLVAEFLDVVEGSD